MKGIVLAGGKGTRLRPVTRVVNKHVLPVYDEPVVFYPIRTLLSAGIDEILVISNAEHIGKYMELLETSFDADFSYMVQSEPKGIAHAVGMAEEFVDDEFVVVLGDNVLFGDASPAIREFEASDARAKIFLTRVEEPSAYGIAAVEDGVVTDLREKPESADSDRAIIGLYCYTDDVFDVIDGLAPSDRGEYEITDVNAHYLEAGDLDHTTFDGAWFDVGTPEGLFEASRYVAERGGEKPGLSVPAVGPTDAR